MKKNFTILFASLLIAWFLGLSVVSAYVAAPILPPIWIPPVMPAPQAPSTPSVTLETPSGWGYTYVPLFVNTQTETQIVQTTTEMPVIKSPKKIDLTDVEYTWPCKPPYLCDFISM